jgi:hypothetical protein
MGLSLFQYYYFFNCLLGPPFNDSFLTAVQSETEMIEKARTCIREHCLGKTPSFLPLEPRKRKGKANSLPILPRPPLRRRTALLLIIRIDTIKALIARRARRYHLEQIAADRRIQRGPGRCSRPA